jgi:hypothetical protein
LYYITPFALALAILGGRELWLSLNGRRGAPAVVAVPSAQPAGPEPGHRNARDRVEAPSPIESK